MPTRRKLPELSCALILHGPRLEPGSATESRRQIGRRRRTVPERVIAIVIDWGGIDGAKNGVAIC
jgi:hypothetical protein